MTANPLEARAAGQRPAGVKRGPLSGQVVAITGRLAAMTRAAAAQCIIRSGGRFCRQVTTEVTLLVIGQDGWPVDASGRLTLSLRRARLMQQRGAALEVIDENEFLVRAGLAPLDGSTRRFTVTELSRLLDVPGWRLRQWIKEGVLAPGDDPSGLPTFDFRQLASIRAIVELARGGADERRIRRSLRQWAALVADKPAAAEALAFVEREGQLLWRTAADQLIDARGQMQLDFAPRDEPTSLAMPARPLDPEELFAKGCAAEACEEWSAAVRTYRQALRVGGPDAVICFNLASALARWGKSGQAIERYWQAVELEPQFAEAWNNLGVLLEETGEQDEARAAYVAALGADPCFADAHYNLADLLDRRGQADEARAHWKTYLQFDSSSAWADHARRRLSG